MSKKVFLSIFVLLIVAIVVAGNFYWQLRTLKNNPLAVAEKENAELLERVGKLILLPDEKPTIATVTDPEKLSDQAFFVNAKTGYKVLVFSVSKKAILYDPILNKIIEVAPFQINEDAKSAGQTKPKTTQ